MVSSFNYAYKLIILTDFNDILRRELLNCNILSYQERLTVFNLETLDYRRLSCDLTMYYKAFLTP